MTILPFLHREIVIVAVNVQELEYHGTKGGEALSLAGDHSKIWLQARLTMQ